MKYGAADQKKPRVQNGIDYTRLLSKCWSSLGGMIVSEQNRSALGGWRTNLSLASQANVPAYPRAMGGLESYGKPYLVGEQGPELSCPACPVVSSPATRCAA